MVSRIKHKRGSSAGASPSVGSLQTGELAINSRDGRLFTLKDVAGVQSVITLGAEMSPALAAALKEESGAAFLAAIGAQSGYQNFQLFTSSGTFNTPAGVTKVRAIVIGGGGGGGGIRIIGAGGNGGNGGVSAKAEVSVAGAMSVTVGSGGAGTNSQSVNGTAGTSSSFGGLTATGGGGGIGSVTSSGAPGADGIGSGGDLNGHIAQIGAPASLLSGIDTLLLGISSIHAQIAAIRDDATITALPYSLSGSLLPGCGGKGDNQSANDASGGVGGAVLLFW